MPFYIIDHDVCDVMALTVNSDAPPLGIFKGLKYVINPIIAYYDYCSVLFTPHNKYNI